MISKAKSIKGSVASVSYIQNDKGEAYELMRQGIASDKPSDILKEFRMMQQCNTRFRHAENSEAFFQSQD